MADEIKLSYDDVADMAKAIKESSDQLDETLQEMFSIANMLESGALLGLTGTFFVEALRNKLHPGIIQLREKLQEMQLDLRVANEMMREVDAQSNQQFE